MDSHGKWKGPCFQTNPHATLYARTSVRSEKKARPRLARNPFNLNFFDSAQCLMVRRWRLIGYFPILYNPHATRCQMIIRIAAGRVDTPATAELLLRFYEAYT
jgi:hypothetical protein